MGPHNWRSAIRLELWVQELTWKQWIDRTNLAWRKHVYKSWSTVWFDPNKGPPLRLLP